MQIMFALVDFIFEKDNYEIATLNEARNKWELFKTTVDQSESAQAAIDALDVEITINHEEHEQTIMDMWQQDRNRHQTQRKTA